MIFMEYWFGAFAALFFLAFWLTPYAFARRLVLLLFCVAFHAHFAGPAGVLPIILIGILTFLAGLSGTRTALYAAISLNVAALLFYKYTSFLSHAVLGTFSPSWAEVADLYAKQSLLAAMNVNQVVHELESEKANPKRDSRGSKG